MPSISTISLNRNWTTRDWKSLRGLRDQQSKLCKHIAQKRQQQVTLEESLATILGDLAALEAKHGALEREAQRIDQRIHAESRINDHFLRENRMDFASLDRNEPQLRRGVRRDRMSVDGVQYFNNRRGSVETRTHHVREEYLFYPSNSSPSERIPDSPSTANASFLIKSPTTLVELREEFPSNGVNLPPSASSTTVQNSFFDQSPRNSESKAGTPIERTRRRAKSFLSSISRSPLPPSPYPAGHASKPSAP